MAWSVLVVCSDVRKRLGALCIAALLTGCSAEPPAGAFFFNAPADGLWTKEDRTTTVVAVFDEPLLPGICDPYVFRETP
jgi:hypothetical protein